jgi:hypothetical protein
VIAQLVTFQNEQIGLICAEHNWDHELKLTLDLPTVIDKAPITLIEARLSFAQTARYTLEWIAYLANAKDSAELRIFLSRIRGETIAVPLWPDQCELQNGCTSGAITLTLKELPVRYGATWLLANDDFSQFEIITISNLNQTTRIISLAPGVRYAWPAGTQMYPLLFGRLTDRPKPESITDETLEVGLKIKENSGFARRLSTPAGVIPVVGAHISRFATTPLWHIAPNHARPLDWTELPDIIYEQVGFGRQEQQRVYDHRNARGVELEYFQNSRADITAIERIWRDRRGNGRRFMVPTWRGEFILAADTPAPGYTNVIRVEKTEYANPAREPQPGDPFIALIGGNDVIDPYQLSSINQGTTTDSLTATVTVAAHAQADTIVSALMLARCSDPKLEWNYTTPWLAMTRVKMMDLPHEYEDPPPESKEPARIFRFTEDGVKTWRFTSYENQIVIPSGTWAGTYPPGPFAITSDTTSLDPTESGMDLKSFRFTDNPLNKLWPFALDGSLHLDVVEVDAANPQSGSAIYLFFGDVTKVTSDYVATIVPFGSLLNVKCPRHRLQVLDNYIQFSPPTRLNAASFRKIVHLYSATGQTIIVTDAASHALAAQWFADGGWLEVGVNTTFERRGILHSIPSGADKVTLTLDRPLLKPTSLVQGAQMAIYPGYDGSIDQCASKFNNAINHGGHPFIPNVNPFVKAMKAKNVSGGKKG